jgi:cell division transport system permease protein
LFDKQLVNLVNDNIKKRSMWILIISGFLTFIAVLLINSSLRLSIHSNRFIIKTMQMVGYSNRLLEPFVMRKLGMIGALLAILLLLTYM